jgi:uncharacterized protein
MPVKKTKKPDFYRTFMNKGFFPNSNKIVKFLESENYWIFKTGSRLFKVKKKDESQSTIPLEEIFCTEIAKQIQQHSPLLEAETLTIKKKDDSFVMDWDNTVPSSPLYYVIALKQLTDRGFLSNVISKNKLSETTLKRVGAHLYRFHQDTEISSSKVDGSPDALKEKLENLIYQSKKFLNVTITQAIIDMSLRPLLNYLSDNRKVFLRRLKQGHIRKVHGSFIPRKIHVSPEGTSFLGKTSDPLKNQFCDIASDVADLSVELNGAELGEMSDFFIDTYSELSDDQDLKLVLPVYQALRCLFLGLKYSIEANVSEEQNAEPLREMAAKHYEQTIDVIRGL